MKLHELFEIVPIHSRLVLEVVDDERNTIEERTAGAWCDDNMPDEFDAFADCDVFDIKGDVSGVLRIVVMTSERIVKRTGAWYYYDSNGTKYEIAELNVPNATATYDIGALIRMHPDVGDGMTVYGWFAGVGSMSDMELIESCHYALKSYREKNL